MTVPQPRTFGVIQVFHLKMATRSSLQPVAHMVPGNRATMQFRLSEFLQLRKLKGFVKWRKVVKSET